MMKLRRSIAVGLLALASCDEPKPRPCEALLACLLTGESEKPLGIYGQISELDPASCVGLLGDELEAVELEAMKEAAEAFRLDGCDRSDPYACPAPFARLLGGASACSMGVPAPDGPARF